MLLRLDYRKLAIQREPEPKQARKYYSGSYRAGSWYEEDWADDSMYASGSWARSSKDKARSVYDFVLSYPEETADLLEQYGINVQELYECAPWLK